MKLPISNKDLMSRLVRLGIDSRSSTRCGNFLDKRPADCSSIIESKSKVRHSRSKSIVAKVSTEDFAPGVSPDVAELKELWLALYFSDKRHSPVPDPPPVNSVGIDDAECDPEKDILLLEAILNSEPSSPLPNHANSFHEVRKELKICEAKTDETSCMNLSWRFECLVRESRSYKGFVAVPQRANRLENSPDIKGINPEFCTHKILIEEDYTPAVQHQRRVNPKIHDVIKKEVEKLLATGLIYPVYGSGPWEALTLSERIYETPFLGLLRWNEPFELMCDASDFALGAVLGEQKGNVSRDVHIRKIRSYLVMNKCTVYWIIPPSVSFATNDSKADCSDGFCSFKRVATPSQKRKFFKELKHYFLEDPFSVQNMWVKLFDVVFLAKKPMTFSWHATMVQPVDITVLNYTARNVFDFRILFAPNYKDAHELVKNCDSCQRQGKFSQRDEMPQNSIQVCEIFDVWALTFMGGSFPSSKRNK
ncbi:hypothetical protein Tco_0210835 [Tanacetum coccineum]